MAQDQKVTLEFKMSDDTVKSVEFIVPGGKDGEDSPPIKLNSPDSSVSIVQNENDFSIKAKMLTSDTGNGNFSFGYPDYKAGYYACGYMGEGVYWKTTLSLSNAGAGNTNVSVNVWLRNLPCKEDGSLVSHRVVVQDTFVETSTAIPNVSIWLICDVTPTHLIDIVSGSITQISRSPDATTTGLPDYPTATDGTKVVEPDYWYQYFYDAFTD